MAVGETARADLVARIEEAMVDHQLVVIAGPKGRGQKASVDAVTPPSGAWQGLNVNGHWLAKGYLAGFHDFVDGAMRWCATNRPDIIARHEQSLKRMFPRSDSPHFQVPRDLTGTASKEERTRFYHHEYQNKLIVGLNEFLFEYAREAERPTLLKIDNASSMSPTAVSLLQAILRRPSNSEWIRFVLIDYERRLFFPQAITVEVPEYSYDDIIRLLNFEREVSTELSRKIYLSSHGNAMVARSLFLCEQSGIQLTGYLDAASTVDTYLAACGDDERRKLLSDFISSDCQLEDYLAIRNYETFESDFADQEHARRHRDCMESYNAGRSPLVALHAWALRDKYQRLAALVEPSEILMEIGLYDTWFTFFAELFGNPSLRRFGSGDDPANATAINAAFVLYSLGAGKASVPYLDEFRLTFPNSKYVPTALYAQSMTYARYQQPVNLPLAEKYALMNLAAIEAGFVNHEKYEYIKVFAENAYAYIKARQGKYREALQLCTDGNRRMMEAYGNDRFKLHRSILIYNTSQVYELLGDYERAEQQLRLAISYDPYYGEYHNDLGNLLCRIDGRADEALAAYTVAIELCPPYYEAYLNRGVLLANLGSLDAAVEDFQRVLEIKPSEWRALLHLATTCLKKGEHAEALRMLHCGLEIEPFDADLHCNIGLAYSELGDAAKSVEHYRAAIAIVAGHAASHNNLAIELHALGRLEEALEHANTAVEIGGDADYDLNRAIILKQMTESDALTRC